MGNTLTFKDIEKAKNKSVLIGIQDQQKYKIKLEHQAVAMIQEKLEKREKLNFKNDWKVMFYKSKLKGKAKVISGLNNFIKALGG